MTDEQMQNAIINAREEGIQEGIRRANKMHEERIAKANEECGRLMIAAFRKNNEELGALVERLKGGK